MTMSCHVRPADHADIRAVTEIYAHHVEHGTGTFEEQPPSAKTMRERWQALVSNGYPYLVAATHEPTDPIVGFAYAGPYKPRSAYRYTVEDSVYVAPGFSGKGVGRQLLKAILRQCSDDGYRQMIAAIGDSANQASIALHHKLGFEPIGTAQAVGWKFGRWLDVVYMQRSLSVG